MQATLLKPFEVEVETEEQDSEYTAWFRAKVQEAIDDPGPYIPHDAVMARIREIIAKAEQKQSKAE